MADDRKNYNEEYQYADIDLAQEAEQEPPIVDEVEQPTRRRLNVGSLAKKILIPVFVIVAIYLVYQFIGPDNTNTSSDVDFAQAQTSNNNNQAATGTTTSGATSSISQNVATSLAQSDLALEGQVDRLKSTQSQLNAQMKTMTDNVKSLSDRYSGMQSQLNDIQSSIKELNNKVTKPAPVVSKAVKRTPHRYLPPAPRVTYSLKALVPGRAWLQASNGGTVTVKVGDQLQGYGIVTAIEPVQGWVATSSGKYIGYGSDDA